MFIKDLKFYTPRGVYQEAASEAVTPRRRAYLAIAIAAERPLKWASAEWARLLWAYMS